MEEFKMCSDGEFMPVSLPCPPPYSGPYYYYPYENIPFPPADGYTDISSGGGLSAGAVAGIIILVSFIFIIVCVCAVKCRSRSLGIFGNRMRSSRRNTAGNNEGQGGGAGEYGLNGGHDMLVNIAGAGLEQKLVSLLPVFEYVGFQEKSKVDHSVKDQRSSTECAVCLSPFEEKEIVRVLPKCHHTFHLPCIDKWFESHANCPLCRERITLQTIQLYFKHPHCPNDPPDQLQQPAGPLDYQQINLNHCNSDNHSDQYQNDQHPPAEPARPGADHHANDQQFTGLLMPPGGTLMSCTHPPSTAIEDHHQNDQHSATKYLDDHQLAGPTCDHNINDQEAAELGRAGLQGLDHHQNVFLPEFPEGEAHDHHQIDQNPAEPCWYQHADQPARHVGGFHVSDHQGACAGLHEGLKGHENRSPNATTAAAAARNDQPCTDDHPTEETMQESNQMRVSCNPNSLNHRSGDKKTTSNPGSSDEVLFSVHDFYKKNAGNSDHVVVYLAPDHHPRTSFNLFKRSLSTGCLNIELEHNRSKLRHNSFLARTAREML